MPTGLERHLAVRSVDIGELDLACQDGIPVHVADTLAAVAVEIEFDLRIAPVDREDLKRDGVHVGGAGPTADQRVASSWILGEHRGLRPRLGNLSWCLIRKLQRGLLTVARSDRHIAEGDGILADGGGAPLGMAVVRVCHLRRVAVDAQNVEFNGPMSLLEGTLPVAEQIALVIELLIERRDPACRSDSAHRSFPLASSKRPLSLCKRAK